MNDHKLKPTVKHIIGFIMLLIGLVLAYCAVDEATSYFVNVKEVTAFAAWASLLSCVGTILIVVGMIQNTTIKAHNLIIELVGKGDE